MAWLEPFARAIDAVNEKFGRAVSWLTLALVVVTALVAIMRYSFSVGWIWMQDAYLWLNGIIFMLGAGYTLLHDKHVRVDIFYVSRGPRFRAAVDLAGSLIFLLPTILVVLIVSVPYVRDSWSRYEGSLEAGGLPGVFLLKSVLLLFAISLGAQGLSLAARSALVLAGRPAAQSGIPTDDDQRPHD